MRCAVWANPIEARLGLLRQFALANFDHPNHTARPRALHAYLRWRNANACDPHVLAAQRREQARVRKEGCAVGRPTTTYRGVRAPRQTFPVTALAAWGPGRRRSGDSRLTEGY
ncbi:hypothetical protein GCM10009602_35300 [Nocardiopsis tropica]